MYIFIFLLHIESPLWRHKSADDTKDQVALVVSEVPGSTHLRHDLAFLGRAINGDFAGCTHLELQESVRFNNQENQENHEAQTRILVLFNERIKYQLQIVPNILFKSVNQENPMFLKGIHSETWNTARLPSTAGILSLKSPND